MQAIEAQVFAAGMPVAALMEKVAGLVAQRVQELYPRSQVSRVGVLVGPGHNGGDALVVARELHHAGYQVCLYQPLTKLKELTTHHARYAEALGIVANDHVAALADCDLIIDGLFGFGLERPLTGAIATAVEQINQWSKPVVSIDVPSGIDSDTGAVLGTAIRATHTLCLGLWKLGLVQDVAQEYVGQLALVDFDLPLAFMRSVLDLAPLRQRLTQELALQALPIPRSPNTHKYKQGHLLIIAGSQRYLGAAILAALGARASGVGMLSLAVPASLQATVVAQVPEAIGIPCPETPTGAIAHFPKTMNLADYQTIACGPGLTQEADAVVQQVLASDRPLVLDADGLNILAQLGTIPTLQHRTAPTVLTPHPGEFKRLFPDLLDPTRAAMAAVQEAARQSQAIVVLKGARVAIADPEDQIWINPESTPALARGGSGDVLTGLMGGLMAQAMAQGLAPVPMVYSAVWWHAQVGLWAAQRYTELGVDAHTLTQSLGPALEQFLIRKTASEGQS